MNYLALGLGVASVVIGGLGYRLGTSAASAEAEAKPARRAPVESRAKLSTVNRALERSLESAKVEEAPAPTLVAVRPGSAAEASDDDVREAEDIMLEEQGLPEEEKIRRAQARLDDLHAGFDERFQSQSVDRAWQSKQEPTLTRSLESASVDAPDVKVASVDCRADICRSVLQHDTERPSREFMLGLLRSGLVGLENHFHYEDGKTTMYSLRRDDALPVEE